MLAKLLSYFPQYGYWVIFFGVMLENAGVPVPGETILLAAGFFAAQGHFHLWTVMAIAGSGAMLGNKTILFARFVTGLRVFAALFAGAARMHWRTFALYNLAGAVLWAVAITLL